MAYTSTITVALLLVCHSVAFAQEHQLAGGPHTLYAKLDKELQDPVVFFQDVRVRVSGEDLKLVILKDLAEQTAEAEDDASKKEAKPRKNFWEGRYTTEWPIRPEGAASLLPTGKTIEGRIEKKRKMQFGFTALRNGELQSLHFVGEPSGTGASGKVFLLSAGKQQLVGDWQLYSVGYLIGGR
ncbi:MAG: hypothetical protein AAGI63_18890 [Planctomycetota bacterium]